MSIQYPFRASKSRLTKQQEKIELINQQIIKFMLTLKEDKDAGSLWIDLKNIGLDISHSSFNNKLKKLVAAGHIEKRSFGYNKHYHHVKI